MAWVYEGFGGYATLGKSDATGGKLFKRGSGDQGPYKLDHGVRHDREGNIKRRGEQHAYCAKKRGDVVHDGSRFKIEVFKKIHWFALHISIHIEQADNRCRRVSAHQVDGRNKDADGGRNRQKIQHGIHPYS